MKFDWHPSTRILRSSAIRAIALIPVLGYLIIFSSELSGWLNTTVIGDTFLIEPTTKIRMLYYGGVTLFVALLLHSKFCPDTVKNFDNAALAMDDFWRDGSPRKAHVAIQRLLFYICRDKFYPKLLSTIERNKLEQYKTAVFDYLAKAGFSYTAEQNEILSSYWVKLSGTPGSNSEFVRAMQDPLKVAFEQHSIENSLIKAALGASIIRAEHEFDQIRLTWILIPTTVLSWLGLTLIAIPAVDTFIQVIIIDMPKG
jgi:hypothetical protein